MMEERHLKAVADYCFKLFTKRGRRFRDGAVERAVNEAKSACSKHGAVDAMDRVFKRYEILKGWDGSIA